MTNHERNENQTYNKIACHTHYNGNNPLGQPLLIVNVGKHTEKLGPCVQLVGMENGAATVENNMAVPQKIKKEFPSNSTFRYVPQRTESRELNRYLYTHVYNSSINH